MPRGYLKRFSRQVGQKAARGGGNGKRRERRGSWDYWYDDGTFGKALYGIVEDEEDHNVGDYIEQGHQDGLFDYYYEEEPEERHYNVVDPASQSEDTATAGPENNSVNLISEDDDILSTISSIPSLDLGPAALLADQNEKTTHDEDASYSLCAPSEFENDDVKSDTSFTLVGNEDKDETISLSSFSLLDFLPEVERTIAIMPAPPRQKLESHDDLAEREKSAPEAVARATETTKSPPPSVCAICLEERITTWLLNNCTKDHPQACLECLRTHYVEYAMLDPKNYPLKCFWPGCKRFLRDTHIQRLVKNRSNKTNAPSQEEVRTMQLFYQNTAQAKDDRRQKERLESHRRRARQNCMLEEHRVAKEERIERELQERLLSTRVHNLQTRYECEACRAGWPVYPARWNKPFFVCQDCRHVNSLRQESSNFLSRQDVITIVEAVGKFLVNCPKCARLIVKDGGCDHMTCVCSHDFSFAAAKQVMDQDVLVAGRHCRALR